ncbi:MAG: 2-C-methyl-D-erythritol 4-phosphate cytidylyltransferase [Bacillota bacterium]
MSSERTVAVIPAAGRGDRMGAVGLKKVYLPLGDRPVLAHTLGVFERCPLVDEVVLAVAPGDEGFCRREVLAPFSLKKVTGVIHGGVTRNETVRLALRYIGKAASLIVTHDGARPLLPPSLLETAILAGRECGALVVGLPAKDTIKRVASVGGQRTAPPGPGAGPAPALRVVETLDRSEVWQIQTPQVFWRDLLDMAFGRASPDAVTDDAALVEAIRHPVLVLPGSEENMKITTPFDLVLAQAILDRRVKLS